MGITAGGQMGGHGGVFLAPVSVSFYRKRHVLNNFQIINKGGGKFS